MTELLENREACLALVEQSPAAVSVHDKARWLSLFAPGAVVEDPVGSRPHVNENPGALSGAIGRFYETFIAANDIRFHVQEDIVCNGCVLRDLTIEIQMSPRVRVSVPMHLRYQLTEVSGGLKIEHLAAHWELLPMLGQQMQFGLASVIAGGKAFWRMLRYLGLSGIAGFSQARHTIGEAGKTSVRAFVDAFNSGDVGALSALGGNAATVEWPAGESTALANWRPPADTRLQLGKMLAAGDCVSASLKVERDQRSQPAVAMFRFDPGSGLLRQVECYVEQQD